MLSEVFFREENTKQRFQVNVHTSLKAVQIQQTIKPNVLVDINERYPERNMIFYTKHFLDSIYGFHQLVRKVYIIYLLFQFLKSENLVFPAFFCMPVFFSFLLLFLYFRMFTFIIFCC